MKHDDKHVITGNAVVIWDGITRPETKDGKVIHSLKVAIAPGSPEIAELMELVQNTLNGSKFKGVLPPGGKLPFIVAGTDKPTPDPQVTGYTMINAKTRTGAPTVHDINGAVLSPMTYGGMLYPGAVVKIIVHAFEYDSNGNQGIALGIDGIQVIDATAPKLAIASGVDTAAAFGGAPAAAAPVSGAPAAMAGAAVAAVASTVPQTAPPAAPAAPATDFLDPPVAPPTPTMTPKAGGHTYETLKSMGWTDEAFVNQGYMPL